MTRTATVGALLLVAALLAVLAVSGIASGHPATTPAGTPPQSVGVATDTGAPVGGPPALGDGGATRSAVHALDVEEDDEEPAEDDEPDDEEEEGTGPLGNWWGLGDEATEAPFVGLVELGSALLVVGVAGYAAGKRTGLVPPRWRRHLLSAHEWTMLAGVALTAPHFLAVEEWAGLGLLVATLLVIEVASGFYGRYLHRYVVRLGRGDEPAPVVGRVVETTRTAVFSRWR
ncbi:MAG: hypothetical protein V5A37_03790, partial [Halobacteriales archaeon]